jgi:Methyltransferase domain
MPGWVNVDLHWPVCDIRATVYRLPFRDGMFSKVYLGHVLEHLEYQRIPEALAEVQRVLASGAEVMVVGPCLDKARALGDWQMVRAITPADPPDLSGCGHAWAPTTELTIAAMIAGGLADVEEVPVSKVSRPEWPNTVPWAAWQCAARGQCRPCPLDATIATVMVAWSRGGGHAGRCLPDEVWLGA